MFQGYPQMQAQYMQQGYAYPYAYAAASPQQAGTAGMLGNIFSLMYNFS